METDAERPAVVVRVRPAVPRDAAVMADIYNDAVLNSTATFDLEPQSAAARRRWLADAATYLALVAEAGGRVVGWASLTRWSERGAYAATAESSLYVAPEHHRSGVGLTLGTALLGAAPGLGLRVVIAQVCAENSGGLALAARLGFERVGLLREVGFKFGRRLDVVVCQRLV